MTDPQTSNEGHSVIHDTNAVAARAATHAAAVANTGQAMRDEYAQARRARSEERRLRRSLEVLGEQLATAPIIGPDGVIDAATPESVLHMQRGAGTAPEPSWNRIREFIRRVLEEGGADPHTVLEDLHIERRAQSVLASADQVQQDLYNQAHGLGLGQAWHPAPGTEQQPHTAETDLRRPQPVPTQPHLGGVRDTEMTAVLPPMPAGLVPGAPSLPTRPQPHAAGQEPAVSSAAEVPGPGEPSGPQTANHASTVPSGLGDGATQTFTLDLSDEPANGKGGGKRPLALASGRSSGKAAGRSGGAEGGGGE